MALAISRNRAPGEPASGSTAWRLGKKTTIVARAYKLLVALCSHVTAGVVIEGAIVKSA